MTGEKERAIETLKEYLCAMCAYGSQSMETCDIRGCDNRDAIKALEQGPKTGHWIKISSTDMYCSECNEMEHLDTSRKFCAYCGTRMVEPQESEEE